MWGGVAQGGLISDRIGDSRNSSCSLPVPEDVPEMPEQLHANSAVQCSSSESEDNVPLVDTRLTII